MRAALQRHGAPLDSVEIMLASLSDNTMKQYEVCLKRWFAYANEKSISPFEASVPSVLSFLTFLFNSGSQYGSLNSYRAALSMLIGPHISNNDAVKRFFKGAFRLRPPLPKYDVIWDTSTVLETLETWYPNEQSSLERLSKKCATLLALTTAHRVQTLSKINIQNITVSDSHIEIKIPDLIKTSRLRQKQPLLRLPFFTQKPEICPALTLTNYLEKTKNLRGDNQSLFISYRKPYKTVGTQSISRWIKCTLKECGIDVSIFSAHSTRHASTSRARHLGLNIDTIRNTAGWSGTSTTFARFYDRNIVDSNNQSLARLIIEDNNR